MTEDRKSEMYCKYVVNTSIFIYYQASKMDINQELQNMCRINFVTLNSCYVFMNRLHNQITFFLKQN